MKTASAKGFADAEPFFCNRLTVGRPPRSGVSPARVRPTGDHQLFGLKYHHHLSVRVRNIRFH